MEIAVPGGVVWADDSGGDGPPVVLLHSGMGDSRGWSPVLGLLTPWHRVIRYDVRGYGRSPKPTGSFTMRTDLQAVLDHFSLDRAFLVGCSLGGTTAMTQALAEPESVAGLVLLCSGLSGFPLPQEPDLDARYDALFAAGDVAGLVRFASELWAEAGADEHVVSQLEAAIPGWLAQAGLLQPDDPVYDRLGELRLPAVVLAGDKDRPFLAACAGAIAARIPGCRFVWAPGVDHFPVHRAPELVAGLVLELTEGRTDAGGSSSSRPDRA